MFHINCNLKVTRLTKGMVTIKIFVEGKSFLVSQMYIGDVSQIQIATYLLQWLNATTIYITEHLTQWCQLHAWTCGKLRRTSRLQLYSSIMATTIHKYTYDSFMLQKSKLGLLQHVLVFSDCDNMFSIFLLHTGANSDFHSKEEKNFQLVLQRGWLWQHFFPLIDACNRKWCRTRDGWIISGFVASTLVLVVAVIELILVILTQIHQKQVVRYYLNLDFRIKCDTCVHFLFK